MCRRLILSAAFHLQSTWIQSHLPIVSKCLQNGQKIATFFFRVFGRVVFIVSIGQVIHIVWELKNPQFSVSIHCIKKWDCAVRCSSLDQWQTSTEHTHSAKKQRKVLKLWIFGRHVKQTPPHTIRICRWLFVWRQAKKNVHTQWANSCSWQCVWKTD